jgi:Major Facilitator Superfamily
VEDTSAPDERAAARGGRSRAGGVPGRPVRTLAWAQFSSSVGDGAFYVTSALFFTRVVGLPPAQVGLGLSLAWGLGFLASAATGHAADRLGLRRSAVASTVVTALALSWLAAAGSLADFVVATCVYALAQATLGGLRQGLLVALVEPAERVRARGRLQATNNAGIGVGAAAGGLALLAGSDAAYRGVLAADAVTFLLAACLLARLPAPGLPPRVAPGRWLDVLRDRPFVAATLLHAALYLYMPVLSVLVPLWIAGRTAAATWSVAALFVVNTLGVVALQQAAARRVTGLAAAARSVAGGGALLGVGCLLLAVSGRPAEPLPAEALLLLGGLVLVAGEVLLAAGAWAIAFGLADPSRPGQWQGFFASGIPLARAIGPTVLVALVMEWTGPGWLVLGAVFAAAGLAVGPVVRRHGRAAGRT